MILTPAKKGLNMKLARKAVATLNALWLLSDRTTRSVHAPRVMFGLQWQSAFRREVNSVPVA